MSANIGPTPYKLFFWHKEFQKSFEEHCLERLGRKGVRLPPMRKRLRGPLVAKPGEYKRWRVDRHKVIGDVIPGAGGRVRARYVPTGSSSCPSCPPRGSCVRKFTT